MNASIANRWMIASLTLMLLLMVRQESFAQFGGGGFGGGGPGIGCAIVDGNCEVVTSIDGANCCDCGPNDGCGDETPPPEPTPPTVQPVSTPTTCGIGTNSGST